MDGCLHGVCICCSFEEECAAWDELVEGFKREAEAAER